MKAQKDTATGKWKIQYRYTTWDGKVKKSTKRGFDTKREAEEWLREFLQTKQADLNMRFEDFLKLYYADVETRLREHTMRTKRYIIDIKVLPYFRDKKMNSIKPNDIRKWQNHLIKQGYAQTYLKTINNQANSIFNFAVRYYDLKSNPCTKAGSMGKSKADEMEFYTKDEFMQFIEHVMDKQISYMAFSVLYWTGMRIGELLALTANDIDFEKNTIAISKSYQRLNKRDIISEPKTPKSKRIISIPQFLVVDLMDYISSLYGASGNERIFPVTKSYLTNEMKRGIKNSGVNKRDKPYLMIDKTGINDVRLSWKAKGLLCYLLSLPDDWQVYVKELMNYASDGRDSTNTALSELMNYGYCIRTINRDESGHFKGYIYNVFEVPNSETIDSSDFQPKTVNPKLLRNNLTNELNTLNNNYNNQSIYHSFSKGEIDKMDISKKRPSFQDENGTTAVTDNTNFYKEIISENIEYSYLKERYPYESIVDDILEIMVEVVTSNKDFIRVNGEDKPQEIVKSSFLKLNSSHIDYVLDCMSQNTSKANNIKAYMITTLYNAPMTINAYYTNLVKHDMANNF